MLRTVLLSALCRARKFSCRIEMSHLGSCAFVLIPHELSTNGLKRVRKYLSGKCVEVLFLV